MNCESTQIASLGNSFYEESVCLGDVGLNPGSGRSSGGGNVYPLIKDLVFSKNLMILVVLGYLGL